MANDVCASVNNLYFRAVFFCHFLCVSMPCVSSVCHFRFPTVCFNSLDRFSIGTDGTDGRLQILVAKAAELMIMTLVMAPTD